MTERGILFSGAMVRALLDGTKTQTRRVCKTEPYSNGFHFDGREILCHNDYLPPSAMLMDYREGGQTYTTSNLEGWDFCCPYGQPGDRLWVRETFCLDDNGHEEWPIFRADGAKLPERPATRKPSRWTPSIHMPRWASRILLEVVSVRVERLQDISDQDAIAEGIGLNPSAAGVSMTIPAGETMPRAMYRDVWERINGAGSWDANPWVWCVEFRRIEG